MEDLKIAVLRLRAAALEKLAVRLGYEPNSLSIAEDVKHFTDIEVIGRLRARHDRRSWISRMFGGGN